MNAVKEQARAKINLFLDVLSHRPDGFHDVRTVMHTVSLCDDVTVGLVAFGKRSVKLILEGNKRLPTDNRNLAVQAAELFLELGGINAEVVINLNKRIPVCAGLAGGSSDAAAVLRAMNKLFRRPFTDKALLAMASRLGSDVPYCLVGGTALCEGRGEKITRLPDKIELHVVIAAGKEYVSTPVAYSSLDSMYSNFDGSVRTEGDAYYPELIDWISTGMGAPRGLYNIFEGAVLPDCPGAVSAKKEMMSLGALYTMMSGSGPGVFGIFVSRESAQRAASVLMSKDINAFYACTV